MRESRDEHGGARPPLAITVAGIAGSLILAVVVVVFVRLGFWQIGRLGEVREANRAVAARLDAPPIADVAALNDTTGLFYRAVIIRGILDGPRSIVLPGRSRNGLPGVHLLTPLRVPGQPEAVLVNRGWVPSPDAATVDLALLDEPDTVSIRGLVLPFPGRGESLAPSQAAPSDSVFRRVWFTIDPAALRGQFPYPLMDVTLQALPGGGLPTDARRYPHPLDPPPLTEGSHLGYALQWFSFAIIGIIGWVALVLRSRATSAPPVPIAILVLLAGLPSNGTAQLRPLEPMDWRMFDGTTWGIASAGGGAFRGHYAGLAGTRGTLFEAGNYTLAVRSGRISIELGGTAIWRLDESEQVAQPLAVVEPAADGVRQDAGIVYGSTALRISPDPWPVDLFVRFGTTVPTTSDESGLDRDRSDVFALAGARYRRGALTLTTEQGVGINGSQSAEFPQSDMWTYNAGAAWQMSAIRLAATLVGRQDGHSYLIRGNEDMHEVRVGFDIGSRTWLRVRYIAGLSRFAPDSGLRIAAGLTLR